MNLGSGYTCSVVTLEEAENTNLWENFNERISGNCHLMITLTVTLAPCDVLVCAYLHLLIESLQQLCEVGSISPPFPSPKWKVKFEEKRN